MDSNGASAPPAAGVHASACFSRIRGAASKGIYIGRVRVTWSPVDGTMQVHAYHGIESVFGGSGVYGVFDSRFGSIGRIARRGSGMGMLFGVAYTDGHAPLKMFPRQEGFLVNP